MVFLKEIDESNLNHVDELERKSPYYVGEPLWILAEAYVHRDCSTAYGIYNDDTLVGMVVLLDRPKYKNYSFTDLFIADKFQRNGYAKEAVKCIIKKFKSEGKYNELMLWVHNSNAIAIKIYENLGFIRCENASWDESFFKMSLTI